MKNNTFSGALPAILLLLLTACQFSLSQPTPTATPTATLTNTPTQTATLTPSLTWTPRPTATSILPELAMTLTPLSYDQRLQTLLDKPVCDLPCWWNITPGSTTWEDAQKLFAFLGFEPRSGYYEIKQVLKQSVYETQVDFYESASIVDNISIFSFLSQPDFIRMWSMYEPRDILHFYGQPSRVMLNIGTIGSPGPVYDLELFYDLHDFMIYYHGAARETSSGILVCPDFSKGNISQLMIYMQSEALQSPVEVQTLAQATGLSIEEFTNLFVGDNPPLCFTVKK